jgi:hypothetical protein
MTVNVEYISSIGSPADQSLLARASLVGAGLLKNREARKTALALLFLASEAVFDRAFSSVDGEATTKALLKRALVYIFSSIFK